MPFDKDKNDGEYSKGYQDGKKGDYYSDLEHSNSYSHYDQDNTHHSSYDTGYADGIKNRDRDSESNKSSGCFITTACVNYMGLPDNAVELNILRNFRDNFIQKLPEGDTLISYYYQKSPEIIERISKLDEQRQREIYVLIFKKITYACSLIETKQFHAAFVLYMKTVLSLYEEFVGRLDYSQQKYLQKQGWTL